MPRRDWIAARRAHAKEPCRVEKLDPRHVCTGRLELAHISGRKHDSVYDETEEGRKLLWVNPLHVVKLCASIHFAYDRNRFDLLPYLTAQEQAEAVLCLGSIQAALRHIGGSR